MGVEDTFRALQVEPAELDAFRRERIEAIARSSDDAGFGKVMENAMGALDRVQVDADRQVTAVAEGGGHLHEMALALEKADVSMRMALKVRNKVVQAYQEIMRMSV